MRIVSLTSILYVVIIITGFTTVYGSHCCPEHNTAQTPKVCSHETPRIQTLCPVTENTVNRTLYVDFEGNKRYPQKRIYFCCNDCIATFNAKPDRYIKKLIAMRQPLEQIPE